MSSLRLKIEIDESICRSRPETRRANENKTFAFGFPLQWHCFDFSKLFSHEKVPLKTINRSFLLLSTESSAFSNNSFPFSHWNFLSESTWKKKFSLFFFLLTVKIKDVSFAHTLMKLLRSFFNWEKEFLFTQLNSVRVKNSPNKRNKHRCVIAQLFVDIGEKEFSSHFHRGQISTFSSVAFVFLTETNFIVTTHKRSSFHRKFQLNIDFTSTNKKRKMYLDSIPFSLINKISLSKRISLQQHEIHCSPTDKILLLLLQTKKNLNEFFDFSRHCRWISHRIKSFSLFDFSQIDKTIQWSQDEFSSFRDQFTCSETLNV